MPEIISKLSLKERSRRNLRRFDIAAFLGRRERIGGLLIREEMIELALWEKKANRESGKEETWLRFYHTAPLPEGTIVEGRVMRPDAIREALASLRNQAAQFSLESVVVSLPSTLAQFSIATFPLGLSREQIDEALQLSAESSFPLPPEKLYFDWVISDRHLIEKQEAIVGIAKRADVNTYLALTVQSGFSPIAVETHPMSLSRAFREEGKGILAVFIQPGEITAVGFMQGMAHLQFSIPTFILKEGASEEAARNKKIVDLFERISHSLASGDERVDIEEILLVPDRDTHWGLAPYLKDKKVPRFGDIAQSTRFPGTVELRDGWMAATLGAALRGLIPRRLDRIISFMDIGTELAYERARTISFVDFLQKFSMTLGGFFAIIFAASFFLINKLGESTDAALEEKSRLPPEYAIIKGEAQKFNTLVSGIGEVEKGMPLWENLFQEFDRLGNIGITFKGIIASRDSFFVDGVAANRDALLLLKSVLENSSVFQSDPLPLSLFLGKENIAFSLTLRLKNPGKFFP